MSSAELAYAQARLQSRHGARPTASTWRLLRTSGSLAHFLEAARATELRPWLSAIQSRSSADEIERALCQALLSDIAEVAAWLPDPWLPACDFVARLARRSAEDSEAPQLADFRATWPRMSSDERAALDELVEHLSAHRLRMATCSATTDGWELRAELERDLVRRFRAHAQEAAAAFCFLALVFLDLERLRGALLRRLLLADVRSDVSWV